MRYAPLKGCLLACAAFLVLPVADVLAATKERPPESAQLSAAKKKKPAKAALVVKRTRSAK